jgi:HK97 family phage portal protein
MLDAPIEIAPGRGDLRYASWYTPNIGTGSMPMVGGKVTSYAQIVAEQPWVGAAVMRMLAWAVRVPLKVYRRVDADTRVRLYPGDHPVADALRTPWDRGSPASFTQAQLGPMLVHGNAVTHVLSGSGDKISFDPKDWRYSSPIMPWRDSIQGFKFDNDDSQMRREVSIDEVLFCRWWSPLGPFGISPLSMLGTTVSSEDAAQRYQRANFLNSARPPSAITASDEFLGLDPDERDQLMKQLREDVNTIYGTPENAGKPALLPPGLDWKAVGHTASEAQLIEARKVAREEVSAVYMIPPPMLGILDKATYSNIETQREMVYTDCMGPPLVLIEQSFNAQVIWGLLREDDVYVEFDFGPVLRGSRLDEINALREAISSALMTPNEGRSVLNQAKSTEKGMDDFYLPFNNLQPVGRPPVPALAQAPAPNRRPTTPEKKLHVSSRDGDYELEIS